MRARASSARHYLTRDAKENRRRDGQRLETAAHVNPRQLGEMWEPKKAATART